VSREYVLLRRGPAKVAALVGAVGALGLAVYTSAKESMPELRIYDGYWMLLGAAVTFLVTAPLVWRLRREVSLPIVVVIVTIGSWLPLVLRALRRNIDVIERLEGARYLMAADVVSAAITVGIACLWLALREPGRR
jgi:hypothetical protein